MQGTLHLAKGEFSKHSSLESIARRPIQYSEHKLIQGIFPFHSSLIFGVWVCILGVLGVFWLHIWVFGGILDCIAMLWHFFLPLTLGPCECPTRQYLFAPNFPSCLCISAFYTPNCPCKICQKLHWQGFDMLHIFNRNMHIHLQRGDIIQNSNKLNNYFVTEM